MASGCVFAIGPGFCKLSGFSQVVVFLQMAVFLQVSINFKTHPQNLILAPFVFSRFRFLDVWSKMYPNRAKIDVAGAGGSQEFPTKKFSPKFPVVCPPGGCPLGEDGFKTNGANIGFCRVSFEINRQVVVLLQVVVFSQVVMFCKW